MEISLPWGDITPGDAGPYSDDNWSDVWAYLRTNNISEQGVLDGHLNELAVTGSASPISIASGIGMSDGKLYRNTTTVSVVVPTPSIDTRIDLIVLRKSWSAQTVRITRIAGSEGGLAPDLVQDDGVTWDIPLAEVTITTGGTITIVDQRAKMVTNLRAGGLNREAVVLEIDSGEITASRYTHSLASEGGGEDELHTINGLRDGDMGILFVDDPSTDTVTIQHGVGNIQCFDEQDIELKYGMVLYHYNGVDVIVAGGGGGSGGGDELQIALISQVFG